METNDKSAVRVEKVFSLDEEKLKFKCRRSQR